MKLKALILNCTLKKSPAISNTQALINKAVALFAEKEVATEVIRVVDHYIPFGVSSKESEKDEWPLILEKVKASDILVIGSPIWFGVRSSIAQLVFERLEGSYSETDPNLSDTDGDGHKDGKEMDKDTDPTDPDDYPKSSFWKWFLILLFLALVLGGGYYYYQGSQKKDELKPKPGDTKKVSPISLFQSFSFPTILP